MNEDCCNRSFAWPVLNMATHRANWNGDLLVPLLEMRKTIIRIETMLRTETVLRTETMLRGEVCTPFVRCHGA